MATEREWEIEYTFDKIRKCLIEIMVLGLLDDDNARIHPNLLHRKIITKIRSSSEMINSVHCL